MSQRPTFPARLNSLSNSPSIKPAAIKSAVPAARRPETNGHQPADAHAKAKAHANAKARVPQGLGPDSGVVRARMVQKLMDQGISNPKVLAAMGAVERHRFIDSALVNQAYEDTSLPIGLGQTISKPNVVARMAELLCGAEIAAAGKLLRVLDIGTGCGYQAAVLSHLAKEVYSIERLRGLHDKARENLRPFRLPNVHLLFGDGMIGYAKGAPYAAIIAAAGGEAIPHAWVEQLAVGGRIVAPMVMGAGRQALIVLDKTPHGLKQSVLEAVHFVPLKSGLA